MNEGDTENTLLSYKTKSTNDKKCQKMVFYRSGKNNQLQSRDGFTIINRLENSKCGSSTTRMFGKLLTEEWTRRAIGKLISNITNDFRLIGEWIMWEEEGIS